MATEHDTCQEFKSYKRQVVPNAKAFAEGLISLCCDVVTGETDIPLILLDL